MDNLIIPLIVSLSGLALTGVTILAFKEPPIFGLLYSFLQWIIGAVFVALLIWSIAITNAKSAAFVAVLNSDKYTPELSKAANAASNAVAALDVNMIWVGVTIAGLYIYLTALRSVPQLRAMLAENNNSDDRSDKKDG